MLTPIKWSFAISPVDGALHIIPYEMPPADNLVVVELEERGGMYSIAADKAQALRQLLGIPSVKEVVRHIGPQAADELESLLAAVTAIVDRRAAVLRGEGDEEFRP